jgi:hypothetical protein
MKKAGSKTDVPDKSEPPREVDDASSGAGNREVGVRRPDEIPGPLHSSMTRPRTMAFLDREDGVAVE